MPAFKSIFLPILLLTVASRVKGNSTVTVFRIVAEPVDTSAPSARVIDMSAIGVEPNGGTAYVDKAEFIETQSGAPVTITTQINTFVEAASWVYASDAYPSIEASLELNCTVETNGTMAECIEIGRIASAGSTFTTTTSYSGQVAPWYTLTVTGPIPTSTSSAATIFGNPIFNRLPSFLGGILFIVMFF